MNSTKNESAFGFAVKYFVIHYSMREIFSRLHHYQM